MEAVLLLVVFCGLLHQGELSNNLALLKPTLQSRTFTGGPGENAVDGNPAVDFRDGSCSLATVDADGLPYAWWAVDLSNVYDISHVIITRRNGPQYLKEITLEIYMSSPMLCIGMANECAYIDPELTFPSMNVTCNAGSIGRYLLIRRKAGDAVTLCEVEVYGTSVSDTSSASCSAMSKLLPEYNNTLTADGLARVNSSSKVECSHLCALAGSCVAFSFNPKLGECVFASGANSLATVEEMADWDTFRLC